MGILTSGGRRATVEVARELGIKPEHLLQIMIFETNWSLSPDQTNQYGMLGLIQFNRANQRHYNVVPGMTQEEQIRGPVKQYFLDVGVKPGMELSNLYAAVNQGDPNARLDKHWDVNGTGYELLDHLNSGGRPEAARMALIGTDINPTMLAVVSRAKELLPDGMSIGIYPTGGTRNEAEQAALVRAGWSQTMNSDHLGGAAIDLIPMDASGKPYPNDMVRYDAVSVAMKQAAKELGVDIEWGGDWSNFKDRPHYALKDPSQKLPPTYDPLSGKLVSQWREPLTIIPFEAKAHNELVAANFPGIRPVTQSMAPVAANTPNPPLRGQPNNTQVADMEIVAPDASPVLPAHITTPNKVAPRSGPPPRTLHDLKVHSYHGIPGRAWTADEANKASIARFNVKTTARPDLQDEFTELSLDRGTPPRTRVQGGTTVKTPPERPIGTLPVNPAMLAGRRPTPAAPPPRPSTAVDVLSGLKPSTIVRPEPVRMRVTGSAGGGSPGVSVNGAKIATSAAVPTPPARPASPVEKLSGGLKFAFDNGRTTLRPVVGVRPEFPSSNEPIRVKFGPASVSTGQPEGFQTTEQKQLILGSKTGPDPNLPGEIRGGTSSTDTTGDRIQVQGGAEIRSQQPGALSGMETRPAPEVRSGTENTEPRISTVSTGAPRNPDYNAAPRVYVESRNKDDTALPFVTTSAPEPKKATPSPIPVPSLLLPPAAAPEYAPVHQPAPDVQVDPGGVTTAPAPTTAPDPVVVPAPKPIVTAPQAPPPPKISFPVKTSSTTYQAPGYQPQGGGLVPAGFTPTGQVTRGSNAIADSPGGGPRYTYQTGQAPNGNSTVSWTDSHGNVRTAYTDPSQGAGFIHQGSVTF